MTEVAVEIRGQMVKAKVVPTAVLQEAEEDDLSSFDRVHCTGRYN